MKPENSNNHIDVAVITTSGRWPATGFDRVPSHQKVSVSLDRAARELKIPSTQGWVATVRPDRVIAQNKSFIDNDLVGEVLIDFGPREGGGGAQRAG